MTNETMQMSKKKHIVKVRSHIADILFGVLALAFLSLTIYIKNGHLSFHIKLIDIGYATSISLNTNLQGGNFGFMVGILYFFSYIYCLGYNKEYRNISKIRFNLLYFFSAFLAFLMSISENLFTMFVFYETLTLATYPLICFTKSKQSVLAAKKYLLNLVIPSLVFFLPAIMFIYHKCGNTNFVEGGILNNSGLGKYEIQLLYLAMVYGIAKTAIIPLHKWLPTAMIASAPVSGLLHAVAVVKSGIFALLMVTYYIFGEKHLISSIELFFGINWLTWIGIIGALFSSLVALRKFGIKERLAYSTISHLSIMIILISLFNKNIFDVVIYYAFAHGAAKILLFYSNGIIQKQTGKINILEISGLGKFAPFGFTAFFIGILCIFGIHGSGMYHAKHAIANIALSNNLYIILATILFASVSSMIYLGKIPYYGFIKVAKDETPIHKIDIKMKIAVILIIALNIAMYIKFV